MRGQEKLDKNWAHMLSPSYLDALDELMRESEVDIIKTMKSRKYIYYKTGKRVLKMRDSE